MRRRGAKRPILIPLRSVFWAGDWSFVIARSDCVEWLGMSFWGLIGRPAFNMADNLRIDGEGKREEGEEERE